MGTKLAPKRRPTTAIRTIGRRRWWQIHSPSVNPEAEHDLDIDLDRTALVAYDVNRRQLEPSDRARREAMRPVLEAWVRLIGAARQVRMPVLYTTPVSRADGAD